MLTPDLRRRDVRLLWGRPFWTAWLPWLSQAPGFCVVMKSNRRIRRGYRHGY